MVQARRALAAAFSSGKITVPVLPKVAGRVIALANDADSDVASLTGLIRQDQALAGNIVRIANSPVYASGGTVASLDQAVMRLGLTTVSQLAIAVSLQSEALRLAPLEELRRQLQLHAVVAAGFAAELARRTRADVDVIYLCGLLHSIGKPVILRFLSQARTPGSPDLAQADILELVGEFHRPAASLVANAWKLPRQVEVCAWGHERPEEAEEFAREVWTVGGAVALAGWVVLQQPCDEAALRTHPAWEVLQLAPGDLEAILAHRGQLEQAAHATLG